MSMIGGVREAVARFKQVAEGQGATVDISNVDYEQLEADIQDEYNCGADGSVFDVLDDLHNTVGLEVYGIVVE